MDEGTDATPSPNHMVYVNDSSNKLLEDEVMVFRHNMVELFFLSKSARPDIQTPVAFLCTRVTQLDIDDNK